MQSVLLANLREVGFFQPEVTALQEKEAKFLPYIISKREERQRLYFQTQYAVHAG